MKVKLLSLSPPDHKHPGNVLAVASVEFAFEDETSFIVSDYRVIKNSRPGPSYVLPPTRFGTGKTSAERAVPIVVVSRKTFHEVESLILDAYTKSQLAKLDDDVSSGPSSDSSCSSAGAR
jgi:hypothetical protein